MTEKFGLAAAIQRVRSLSLVTGKEHLVLLDLGGEWKREAMGDGRSVSILLPGTQETGIEEGDRIVHSHPVESGLSEADLLVAYQTRATIIATTPSGCVFSAAPGKGRSEGEFACVYTVVRHTLERAMLERGLAKGHWSIFGPHAMCKILADMKLLTYDFTLSPAVKKVMPGG